MKGTYLNKPLCTHRGAVGDSNHMGAPVNSHAASNIDSIITAGQLSNCEPKSSNRVWLPRLTSETSPSASTSKGFLHSGTRVTPSSVKFKHTISRIWRLHAHQRYGGPVSRMAPPTLATDSLIRQQLLEGTYRPAAARRKAIPKPDGGERQLGMPGGVVRAVRNDRPYPI
jgi:hypothetical protein